MTRRQALDLLFFGEFTMAKYKVGSQKSYVLGQMHEPGEVIELDDAGKTEPSETWEPLDAAAETALKKLADKRTARNAEAAEARRASAIAAIGPTLAAAAAV